MRNKYFRITFFFVLQIFFFVLFVFYLCQNELFVVSQPKKNISIFCFVKTFSAHFRTLTKESYEHCFRHCTDYRLVTVFEKTTLSLPYKFLHPKNWYKEDYQNLTPKMYNGLLAIGELPLFDWYLIADDDSFVNMKNLFSFLSTKNKNKPIMYGHHLERRPGFLSGGGSLAISQMAFRLLIEKLAKNMSACPDTHEGRDDLDLSRCLQSVGVRIGDSRDEYGLERFHSKDFNSQFFGPIDIGFSAHKQYV